MQVDIKNISFSYGVEPCVVRDVSLRVPTGQAVGLIGPNGSGKSTLLKLVSRSLRPDQGCIQLGGKDIAGFRTREIACCLAMVEQKQTIGFDFTVRDIVAMGRLPHRGRWSRESRTDREAIERAMQWAEVERLSGRSVRTLSGGEGQRVFLAMTLAQEPEVLLLDEPTTHLDLRHQLNFLSIVKERIVVGLTVMLAIHDLTLAAQTANQIVMLHDGSVAFEGPPKDVLTMENIRAVFGVEAIVGQHQKTGMLYVLPALPGEQ
ncbi:ABC transporter ATP-binding protein [Candidatus Bipolaricaulota bacterium]|nr:ABC transporter ATP-binding protein [Candidatus Bipolaricaulota bacterium]